MRRHYGRKNENESRGDRALALFEQGLTKTAICERLGMSIGHIGGIIEKAKQRRSQPKPAEEQAS